MARRPAAWGGGALNPVLGYSKVADLVKQSPKENRSVVDVIVDEGLMARDEVERLLDVRALTEPTGTGAGGG